MTTFAPIPLTDEQRRLFARVSGGEGIQANFRTLEELTAAVRALWDAFRTAEERRARAVQEIISTKNRTRDAIEEIALTCQRAERKWMLGPDGENEP